MFDAMPDTLAVGTVNADAARLQLEWTHKQLDVDTWNAASFALDFCIDAAERQVCRRPRPSRAVRAVGARR
jgi:hypothetical protein